MYDFADSIPEMHSGYHYSSTAIEWKYLIDAIRDSREGGQPFVPKVSLDDGIKAVEMGITSQANISNNGIGRTAKVVSPAKAVREKSSEDLLIPLIDRDEIGRYEINLSPSKGYELNNDDYDATSVIIGAIDQ